MSTQKAPVEETNPWGPSLRFQRLSFWARGAWAWAWSHCLLVRRQGHTRPWPPPFLRSFPEALQAEFHQHHCREFSLPTALSLASSTPSQHAPFYSVNCSIAVKTQLGFSNFGARLDFFCSRCRNAWLICSHVSWIGLILVYWVCIVSLFRSCWIAFWLLILK